MAILVIIGVVAVVVARFVTKIVSKLILLVLLVGAGFGIWSQREDLDECQRRVRSGEIVTDGKPCKCEIASFDITVPQCTPPPGVPQP